MHVHITHNGKVVGTVELTLDGSVKDDGSPAARNAIHDVVVHHKMQGGKLPVGEALLEEIVRHHDRATYMGAHHCQTTHNA